MSKQNYGTMCRNIIANLRDRNILPPTVEYRSGKGLIKLTGTDGRYSVVIFGTAKEIHFFLEGVQYAEVLNFPTNKKA